jgi:hypothetical protein
MKTNIALAVGALILLAMLLLMPGAHAQSDRWSDNAFNNAAPDWVMQVQIDARPGPYGSTSYSGTTKDGRPISVESRPGLYDQIDTTFTSSKKRPFGSTNTN